MKTAAFFTVSPFLISMWACGKPPLQVSSPKESGRDTIVVEPGRRPAARKVLQNLEAATATATKMPLSELLSVLPVSDRDLKAMDKAYPDGLVAKCSGGDCTISGDGAAVKMPLTTDDAQMKDVQIGVRDQVDLRFKVMKNAAGRLVANGCETEGVYFQKSFLRLNLTNLVFDDQAADKVVVTYELAGYETGDIVCD